MSTALVTGGSGFFGGLLKRDLLKRGWRVVNIDLVKDNDTDANLISIQGDIRNQQLLSTIFKEHVFDVVFHCAAILAHAVKDKDFLWTSNVDGTRNIAEAAVSGCVKKLVFTSSNCLWGKNFHRPVREDDAPEPVEIYGQSKWEAEKSLHAYRDRLDVVIIRCPTIIEEGRLGLLAILFEFIDEGRKVWVVGGGKNRYQFVAAPDLIDACVRAVAFDGSETFNIGSDDVPTIREVYEHVIGKAGTGARVANLPRGLTLFAMQIAYALGMSPLGPYQYKMIAEDFVFDTNKIKQRLGWHPTLTNDDMLWRAYEYYHRHRNEIERRGNETSAHNQAAKMGVIRLLKWIS